MENKDWLNDYKALKQVSSANPFTVPEGYFDNLEDRIAAYKTFVELRDSEIAEGFTVPENYFGELSSRIQSRITVEEALNIEDPGFVVPADYFDNLEQQIKSRIFVEEALGNPTEHFAVPANYFNQLNKDILSKTANRRGVVRKLFASTAVKYATAACFALLIGGGILLNQLGGPADTHKNSFLHKQLASVPLDEIKSYVQLNDDAGDTQQTVVTEGAAIDDSKLKDALKNYADSVQ